MLEKREWKRIPFTKVAKCRTAEESAYRHVHIVDIHHQGCCIKSDIGFQNDEEIRILVDVPVEGSLYLTGVVMWSELIHKEKSYRTGVKFVSGGPQSDEAHAKLYNFCMMQ